LITRALKGLEDTISITVVLPVWKKTKPDDPTDPHSGWVFADPDGTAYPNTQGLGGPFPTSYPANEAEPFYSAKSIRDIYDAVGDTNGKYTVPVLYDKKLKTIVSNESAEIIEMLNSEFNEFAKHPELDLNPKGLHEEMAKMNEFIYPTINNGVYRCGFATSQQAYDTAIGELTASFDRIEEILTHQRYIAGDTLTLADIRLFVTLLRFDEVYVVYFKTNTRSVATSPAILNYLRELYQIDGVKGTVNMEQIKLHYFASHPDLNKYSIVPKGANTIAKLEEPHNRESVGSNKKQKVV